MESVQLAFFETLKQKETNNQSLATNISELLGISMDSSYRRLRGETPVTIDELYILSKHYNVSFDALCTLKSQNVAFQYKSLAESTKDVFGCFSKIQKDMSMVLGCKTSRTMVASSDILSFHLFKHPELTAFRLHNWIYSMLPIKPGEKPGPESYNYKTMLSSPEILASLDAIVKIYEQMPAIEIWTDDTIMGILKSIQFYFESYLYNDKEELLSLCRSLMQILTELFDSPLRDGLQLYISDIVIENNYIFIQADDLKFVYLKLYSLNNIMTTDRAFCNETELWIQGLIAKSTLVSGASEALRRKFYIRNKKKIEALMQAIMAE